MTADIPIVSLCVVRVLLVWKPIGSDEHFLSKVPMAKMIRRFYLQDPLNIFHMKRVNKYCTSPINNPITSSLSVDNAWVKQTIYASASIFTVSTAILNLVLVRGTPLNTNIVGGKGRGGERGSGVAGERGSGGGGQKRAGTADFSEDCTFLLTHLSRRIVYEEIRKDEG